MHLVEDSPNTFEGSFTKDLIFSKFWLCQEVCKISSSLGIKSFDNIVVLGGWFGNMGLILETYPIKFDHLTMIDADPACAKVAKMLLYRLGPKVTVMAVDANTITYPASKSLLVINTSCNDMPQEGWFDSIPKKALVAIQSRSDHEPLTEMDTCYPMSRTLFMESCPFSDPTTRYSRHMKIGLK